MTSAAACPQVRELGAAAAPQDSNAEYHHSSKAKPARRAALTWGIRQLCEEKAGLKARRGVSAAPS